MMGHTALRAETFDKAMKIGRPVMNKIQQLQPDYYGSDCPIAGQHLANGVGDGSQACPPYNAITQGVRYIAKV